MVFTLALSDADRGVSAERVLRLARHPSETLERVWLRLLAFVWCYEEALEMGLELCTGDQPDLSAKDLTGRVTRVVLVGKPDARRIQRAVDQNPGARVSVLFESPMRLAEAVRTAREQELPRVARAELAAVDPELTRALARSEARRAKVEVTIAGDHFYVQREGEAMDGALVREVG
jgi:uncharacterized protein YaeQ